MSAALSRIEALAARAWSTDFPHEAATCVEIARRLIARDGLEHLDISLPDVERPAAPPHDEPEAVEALTPAHVEQERESGVLPTRTRRASSRVESGEWSPIPPLRGDVPIVGADGKTAFEPWCSIVRAVRSRWARKIADRANSLDDRDEVLSNVLLAVVERYYAPGPRYSPGGWPACEHEAFYTDEEIGEVTDDDAIRFARRFIARCIADLLCGKRRTGHRGLASLGGEYVDDKPNDDDGEIVDAVFVKPQSLTISEDAIIAVIDHGRAARRGPIPLTPFETSCFWEDVSGWARRAYERAFGTLPDVLRTLTRAEVVSNAVELSAEDWRPRTPLANVLILLVSGSRPNMPITSSTSPEDVVARELPTVETAMKRARKKATNCTPAVSVAGD